MDRPHGSGRPTAALVYKLVERTDSQGAMHEVAKFSVGGKSTVGGRKWAGRVVDASGSAAEELVVSARTEKEALGALKEAGARPLQVDLIRSGPFLGRVDALSADSVPDEGAE